MKRIIKVNNPMQKDYEYECIAPMGKNFREDFKPELSPKEMMELGVFGGLYLNSAINEYPKNWFVYAKFSNSRDQNGKLKYDKNLNYFKVKASLSLQEWQAMGWISKYDPRGWFEWYCRYYMGRRIDEEDNRQIYRWKNMTRHITAVKKNCLEGDEKCRPRQRQALLHWSYDSRKF